MPQFNRTAFDPNAKISEYNCEFCGKLFYTKKAGSEYCSDKHRKYNHKKREAIKYASNKNSLMIYDFDKETMPLNSHLFIGSSNAKEYFKERGIKVTLKSLKELSDGETMKVNTQENNTIMKVNRKTWLIY